MAEVKENLEEAILLVLEASREISTEPVGGRDVIREPLKLHEAS